MDAAGGCCVLCGYDKCLAALEFHHVDPAAKEFTMKELVSRTMEAVLEEVGKCMLVCANCHREIHWKGQGLRVPSKS